MHQTELNWHLTRSHLLSCQRAAEPSNRNRTHIHQFISIQNVRLLVKSLSRIRLHQRFSLFRTAVGINFAANEAMLPWKFHLGLRSLFANVVEGGRIDYGITRLGKIGNTVLHSIDSGLFRTKQPTSCLPFFSVIVTYTFSVPLSPGIQSISFVSYRCL